ncbi:ParB/RepB/Spo0J family partition protein [Belnapia sp. T18]|uniref:ParB/RepB/Spo0J family partition protein n=1 Tax=Belnapia arida TaxID=2804533 RepID=A0ABS1UCP1_9PROT|nr:ParB/RepB/Spo0J family partition protein [Belnapia arida]MBL6082424.1 ParB/RepB/Spo0J family partition protein [Belnapia arida]
MAGKQKIPSPILGAAMSLIDEAGGGLVTHDSRFRHSFETPVDRVRPDPGQPRKVMAEAEVAALAATMAEQGQLQPVLVRRDPEHRGHFILVAGERRWRAAKRNGWESILAIEHTGDHEVAALIENLQRVDLTPVEEARGLQRLIKGKGLTQTRTAEILGKSTAEVSATLRILTLPDEVLDGVLTSELQVPRNALVELARIDDQELRGQLIELARQGGLTVRAVRVAKEMQANPVQPDKNKHKPVGANPPRRLDTPLRLAALDRIVADLQACREMGRLIGPDERPRLEALRREIDALLGGIVRQRP